MHFRTRLGKTIFACACSLLMLCLVAGTATAQAPQKTDGKDDDILVRIEGLQLSSQDIAVAKLLLEFKRGGGGDAGAAKFFRDLAGRGAGMREVIGVKTKLREAGVAESFLGASYDAGGTPVEKALLSYRRQVTLDGIQHVVKEFAGRSSRNSIYLAEIGKWPHQSAESLTFSGDIDFSFVSNDTQLTSAMKQAYDAYIQNRTGLTAEQIDSVSTAHGKATLDVYIGEHGRMYAEDQMRGGQLREIDLNSGQVSDAGIPGAQALEQMALEASAQGARGSVPSSKYAAEPGLSMEMVRHFNHDIVQAKIFDPVDSVLKASKYLERSNSAVAGAGGDKTAEFAKSVTAAAQSSDWKTMARLFKAHFGDAFTFEQTSEGGRMEAKVKANADAVNGYFETCNRLMWANAEAGFKLRIDEVEQKIRDLEAKKAASPEDPAVQQEAERLRQEMVKLTDMVESEVAALTKDAHVEPSDGFKSLHEQFKTMVKDFNAGFGMRGLGPDELKEKKFVEELIKSRQKSSLHIAAAYLMDKAVAGAERANNILDFLDDRLLGELRGSNKDFDGFVTEFKQTRASAAKDPKNAASILGGLKSSAASGIQRVNQALNDTIQASSAGRAGVKLMLITGLVDETRAYYEAYNREGWGGLATEFFRRRVPGGSALEQVVMENYMMAGWEVVKTLVPPLGMGEAAVYIGKYVLYDYPVQFYWNEQLGVFVDNLYAGAKFKLISVESYENAKVGDWRLVSVKYSGQTISMESFIKYKKEQIEAMQAELKRPRSVRDMSRSSYYGLTDRYDIDKLLRNTIAATDPALQFVNEMMQHPNVGPNLASHLGDVYRTRWEEAKLGFILTTIKQLEERKAADDALARGQLPELFAELKKLVTDLQIADLVEKNMDAELNTSNLKALMGWLWNSKRDLFSEGNMETDMTRGAEIVLRYLEAYRIVYDARKETEELLGYSPAADHGRRILTGHGFLIGKIEEDKQSAIRWYQFVLKTRAHAEKQLLEIKSDCMPTPALDSTSDRDMMQALAWQEVWQGVWSSLYANESSGGIVANAKEHNAKAAELLKGYREQIIKQGCAAVSITGPESVKLGEVIVLKAEVKLPVVPKTAPVYRYQWSDVRSGMRFADATETIKPKTTTAGDYQVKVEVFQAKNGAWERIGEAVHKLAVELAKVTIKGPDAAVPGEKVSFEAVTSLEAATQSTLRYAWRYVGSANILGTAQSLSWQVATTGKYNLNVVVYQEVDRKSVKLGEATHTLVVELPSVSVYIDGPKRSTVGQNLTYRAKVSSATKGSPQYTYSWSLNGSRLAGNANMVSLAPVSRGNHTVRVEVFQAVAGKWQKAAEAGYPLDVQEPYATCTISTARDRIKAGESTTLNGIISETNLMDTSQLYFSWQIDGRAAGSGNSISAAGATPGTRTVTLEVWMNKKPRPVRLAATSRAIFVEAKPEDKKVVAAKPSVQSTTTAKKTDPPKPVRNWSQLNDKERQNVLDCLCRCNSSATSSVAVSYDPKPSNGSPHCANMANGPCINQGFGCWRHAPEGGSKCAQDCYGKNNVTGVPDSELNKGKDSATGKKEAEAQTQQFNDCVKGEKSRVEDAQKELARAGQKDAPSFFRCGPIGTNWQMIPSNTCCDPFRRDSEKNMDAAWAALQRCGWNEEIQKRQADLTKRTEDCRKKYPGARP